MCPRMTCSFKVNSFDRTLTILGSGMKRKIVWKEGGKAGVEGKEGLFLDFW